MKMSAHQVRSLIDKTIISNLFTKKGGYCDPVVVLNQLNASKQNDYTYILNGCTITIKKDRPLQYNVHQIKNI